MNRHAFLTTIVASLTITTAACVGGGDVPLAEPDQNGTHQNGHPVATAPAGTSAGAPGAGTISTTGTADHQSVQEITIVAHDSMRFDPATLTVEAGRPVRLTLRNAGQAIHDFRLSQGVPRSVKVVARGGETASVTFTLARPGTYQFDCSQFGHAMAGMKGTITATAPGSAGTTAAR